MLSKLILSKEEFLAEHNRLSPLSLRASSELLDRFQKEKKPLLKGNNWPMDKIRVQFITWLIALPVAEKESLKKIRQKAHFSNYPETKLS